MQLQTLPTIHSRSIGGVAHKLEQYVEGKYERDFLTT